MLKTLSIAVTAQHIRLGLRGIDWLCPVARAFRDVFPNDLVSVGYDEVLVVTPGDQRQIFHLPQFVRDAIHGFDDEGVMEPMTFDAERV